MYPRRWFSVVLLAGLASRGALAQAAPSTNAAAISESRWLWSWSPLHGIQGIGPPAPGLPPLPRTLDFAAPRVGLFWTAGNPAALPDEIDSTYTLVAAHTSSTSGSYRRPLDAPSSSGSGVDLAAWGRVANGERYRSAGIGRASLSRDREDRGALSPSLAPYGSSPFVTSDTNAPGLLRPRVTLEGAEGLALGRWRIGSSAGYDALENSSSHSAAAQVGRQSATAITLGASRRLGEALHAGVLAKHVLGSETITLVPNPATIRTYTLDGYLSPQSAVSAQLPIYRRTDRTASAFGAGLAGATQGVTWVLHAQGDVSDEEQVSDISAAPPTDDWHTSGFSAGAAAQLARDGMLVVFSADGNAQHGATGTVSSRDAPFRSRASVISTAVEARYHPTASPWLAAATLSLLRHHYNATDEAAQATTSISAWQPAAGLELDRVLGARWRIGAAYGIAQYTPYATIPDPQGRGPAYLRLVAPAIEIASATARSQQEALTFARRSVRATLVLRLWRASTTAVAGPESSLVPLPTGSRVAWGGSLAVLPRE